MRVLLASESPRRASLLTAAGFSFEVAAPGVDESLRPGEAPPAYVARIAEAKVRAVNCRDSGTIVLGADTTVVAEGRLLGKPGDDGEARETLTLLSGRAHEVLTGVAVKGGDRLVVEVAVTKVWFLPLDPVEIAWYVRSGEPRGKAGGYAIQGLASRFVDRIEGSYTNVVGLPIATVHRLLKGFGVQVDPGNQPAIS